MKKKVSVVIVTKNEESNISECIKSVFWADEIIVVDSGSKDRTCDISRKLGADVIERDWIGYADQKNFAINQTKNNWVLSLDADEIISEELRKILYSILEKDSIYKGYKFPRKNIFFGKWMRYGDLWPDYQIRLFDKGKSFFNDRYVHESVQVNGEICQLNEPIIHHSYENVSEFFQRQKDYALLSAKESLKKEISLNRTDIFFRPFWRFFRSYIIKSGWKDGIEGFIVSAGLAWYVFMRFAIILEFKRKNEIS